MVPQRHLLEGEKQEGLGRIPPHVSHPMGTDGSREEASNLPKITQQVRGQDTGNWPARPLDKARTDGGAWDDCQTCSGGGQLGQEASAAREKCVSSPQGPHLPSSPSLDSPRPPRLLQPPQGPLTVGEAALRTHTSALLLPPASGQPEMTRAPKAPALQSHLGLFLPLFASEHACGFPERRPPSHIPPSCSGSQPKALPHLPQVTLLWDPWPGTLISPPHVRVHQGRSGGREWGVSLDGVGGP